MPRARFVVAEKLRRDIGALSIRVNERSVRTSVSIGLVAYPEDGATVEELMAAVDAALYEAKRSGKDRIVGYTTRTERVATRMGTPRVASRPVRPAARRAPDPRCPHRPPAESGHRLPRQPADPEPERAPWETGDRTASGRPGPAAHDAVAVPPGHDTQPPVPPSPRGHEGRRATRRRDQVAGTTRTTVEATTRTAARGASRRLRDAGDQHGPDGPSV